MNRFTSLFLPVSIVTAAMLLSACDHHSSSNGGSDSGGSSGGGTPPPPSQTSFTDFVHELFSDDTTEKALPRPVDDTDFAFPDNDDKTAYDDIVTPSP